jgi:hypothetical protein
VCFTPRPGHFRNSGGEAADPDGLPDLEKCLLGPPVLFFSSEVFAIEAATYSVALSRAWGILAPVNGSVE